MADDSINNKRASNITYLKIYTSENKIKNFLKIPIFISIYMYLPKQFSDGIGDGLLRPRTR